jgi:hypothetical protein
MKKNMFVILTAIIVAGVIFTGSAWADDAAVEQAVFYVQ